MYYSSLIHRLSPCDGKLGGAWERASITVCHLHYHEFWNLLQLLFGHLSDYAKEGLKTFTDKFGDVPMVR